MVVVDRQQIVPDLWELKINHRKVFVPETPPFADYKCRRGDLSPHERSSKDLESVWLDFGQKADYVQQIDPL